MAKGSPFLSRIIRDLNEAQTRKIIVIKKKERKEKVWQAMCPFKKTQNFFVWIL